MVADILPSDPNPPTPDPGDRVKRLNFNFFRTWSWTYGAYQIEGNQVLCSTMVANSLPTQLLPTEGVKNMVLLYIKLFGNMVENILPADTYSPLYSTLALSQ